MYAIAGPPALIDECRASELDCKRHLRPNAPFLLCSDRKIYASSFCAALPEWQAIRGISNRARYCNRDRDYFLGSANTVTVGFPPTISGIVSFRRTPPSPEVTATY